MMMMMMMIGESYIREKGMRKIFVAETFLFFFLIHSNKNNKRQQLYRVCVFSVLPFFDLMKTTANDRRVKPEKKEPQRAKTSPHIHNERETTKKNPKKK